MLGDFILCLNSFRPVKAKFVRNSLLFVKFFCNLQITLIYTCARVPMIYLTSIGTLTAFCQTLQKSTLGGFTMKKSSFSQKGFIRSAEAVAHSKNRGMPHKHKSTKKNRPDFFYRPSAGGMNFY